MTRAMPQTHSVVIASHICLGSPCQLNNSFHKYWLAGRPSSGSAIFAVTRNYRYGLSVIVHTVMLHLFTNICVQQYPRSMGSSWRPPIMATAVVTARAAAGGVPGDWQVNTYNRSAEQPALLNPVNRKYSPGSRCTLTWCGRLHDVVYGLPPALAAGPGKSHCSGIVNTVPEPGGALPPVESGAKALPRRLSTKPASEFA
jgi:hypothetical protein